MPRHESHLQYRTIDPDKRILTVSKLADRVEEEFPASGLSLVATDAGLHLLLILTGGIFFLVGMENRMRRNHALRNPLEFPFQ